MDSSARDPPPKCHPGTRKRLNEILAIWLDAPDRECDLLWLYGSAGTGKSAIAQTFAEACFEMGRLGAAFFFSRPNSRDKPETVIPSLAYQLCLHLPPYKSVIAGILANDPQLLQKAISIQFKRLIVEPLLHLQREGYTSSRKPLVIILDGLDECAGAQAQCQFISLISEHIQSNPVLWLLCSRPEPHLKHVISRIPEFGRQELLLDQTSKDDVVLFLRDGFAKVRRDNPYTTTSDWPSKEQFDIVLRMSSGHFQVATTVVNFVSDRTAENPPKQLDILVAYLEGAKKIGALNPLAALDLIYTRILSTIPENVLPHTQQILAYLCYSSGSRVRFSGDLPAWIKRDPAEVSSYSAQILSNILRLDQSMFYSTLSKLHSVLRIPTPEEAHNTEVSFYHASFAEFLMDPNRSGKFALKKDWAFSMLAKTFLTWYEITGSHPTLGTSNGENNTASPDQTTYLPGLSWASVQKMGNISRMLVKTIDEKSWLVFSWGRQYRNDQIFAQLRDFDFRKIPGRPEIVFLVNWIYKHYSSDDILRTEPSSGTDFRLLKYVGLLTGEVSGMEKTSFPVKWALWKYNGRTIKQYLFLGYGEKTVLVLFTLAATSSYAWDGSNSRARIDILSNGNAPLEEEMSEYRGWVGYSSGHGSVPPSKRIGMGKRRVSFS